MLAQWVEVGYVGVVHFIWCTEVISESAQPPLSDSAKETSIHIFQLLPKKL